MYLLDIFDGKLSLGEILHSDLRIINAMKKVKEEQLENQRKQVEAIQRQQNEGKDQYEGIAPHLQSLYPD